MAYLLQELLRFYYTYHAREKYLLETVELAKRVITHQNLSYPEVCLLLTFCVFYT